MDGELKALTAEPLRRTRRFAIGAAVALSVWAVVDLLHMMSYGAGSLMFFGLMTAGGLSAARSEALGSGWTLGVLGVIIGASRLLTEEGWERVWGAPCVIAAIGAIICAYRLGKAVRAERGDPSS